MKPKELTPDQIRAMVRDATFDSKAGFADLRVAVTRTRRASKNRSPEIDIETPGGAATLSVTEPLIKALRGSPSKAPFHVFLVLAPKDVEAE